MNIDDYFDARDDANDEADADAHQEHEEGGVEGCSICDDEQLDTDSALEAEWKALQREQEADRRLEAIMKMWTTPSRLDAAADEQLDALVRLFMIEPMTPIERAAAIRATA